MVNYCIGFNDEPFRKKSQKHFGKRESEGVIHH